jgi:hypothetical protein
MKKVVNRMQQDTPVFFRRLRDGGLMLTAISAAILTTPVTLPAVVLQIAAYLAVAASVMSAVSQTAIKNEQE